MKIFRLHIILFMCTLAICARAIDYPTYRPSLEQMYIEGYHISYNHGAFSEKEYSEAPEYIMLSTSRFGEQLQAVYGEFTALPFAEESNSQTGARKAPPSVGAAYARFLALLPSSRTEDGITYYEKDVALSYWGGADMPVTATWAGFLAWFAAQTGIAWEGEEVPLPEGIWTLLLLALCYVMYQNRLQLRKIVRIMKSTALKSTLIMALTMMLFTPSALSQEMTIEACENAIPVQDGFEMRIMEPGYYFFTATTFDLPIALRFIPDERYQPAPQGIGDFSCTPGEYDDPNLIALVNDVSKWGYSMPLEFGFAMLPIEGELPVYQMDVLTEYRDKMGLYGINYEVRAWIMVYFSGTGSLTTHVDSTYRNCLESSISFKQKDTLTITPTSGTDEAYRFPIIEWLNDSVLFRWNGENPLDIWLANECDFNLSTEDPAVLYKFTIDPATGGDSLFLTSQDLYSISCISGQTGTNYIRFQSSETADLHFTFDPAPAPDNNAIPLRIGDPISLPVGLSPLYCFPVSWLGYGDALIWRTDAEQATEMRLYLSDEGSFRVTNDSTTASSLYTFMMDETTRVLQWTDREVDALRYANDGRYYYVRFLTNSTVETTLWYWVDQSATSECVNNSRILSPLDSKTIAANNSGQAYRIPVAQWAERGQDVQMTWEGLSKLTVWIMKTCKGNLKTSNVNYISSFLQDYAIGENTHTFTNTELSGWADLADEDGYIYMRFSVGSEGKISTSPLNITQPDIIFPIVDSEWEEPMAIEQVISENSENTSDTAVKELHNGKLYIRRNGIVYTVDGCVVR